MLSQPDSECEMVTGLWWNVGRGGATWGQIAAGVKAKRNSQVNHLWSVKDRGEKSHCWVSHDSVKWCVCVCSWILLCHPAQLFSSSQTNLASFPFTSMPNIALPLLSLHLLPSHSLAKRHPPPNFSLPILPLVSLMNGFTAGKVLIFIPLSDFCWLLLISNTQRKASKSINKEMNTLHRATSPIVQSLTPSYGSFQEAKAEFS